MSKSVTPATKSSYQKAWSHYVNFVTKYKLKLAPISENNLSIFATYLITNGVGYIYFKAIPQIKDFHERNGIPFPPTTIRLKRITRMVKRSQNSYKKTDPLLPWILRCYLAKAFASHTVSVAVRNVAAFTIGLRLMLRPGELSKICWDTCSFQGGKLRLELRKTKSNQCGVEVFTLAPTWNQLCPVKWFLVHAFVTAYHKKGSRDAQLTRWQKIVDTKVSDKQPGLAGNKQMIVSTYFLTLTQKDVTPFQVFLSKNKGVCFLSVTGKPWSTAAVSSQIAKVAGDIVGAPGVYTGKALRIGGAILAARSGVPLDVIRAVARWKQESTAFIYISRVVASSQGVGSLLGM